MRFSRAGARLAPSAVPSVTRSVDFSLPKPEEAAHVLQSSVPALLFPADSDIHRQGWDPVGDHLLRAVAHLGICGPLLRLTLCLKRNHRRNRIATSPKERSRGERY